MKNVFVLADRLNHNSECMDCGNCSWIDLMKARCKKIFDLADTLFCIAEYNHQALTARACGLKKYLQKIFNWADIFTGNAEYSR